MRCGVFKEINLLPVIVTRKLETHKCTPNVKSLTQENTGKKYSDAFLSQTGYSVAKNSRTRYLREVTNKVKAHAIQHHIKPLQVAKYRKK